MKQGSTRQQGMELALTSAQKRLRGMDPQAVAEQSGSRLCRADDREFLEIIFLNQRYRVSLPKAQVVSESSEEPSLIRRVLIFHYLIKAQGNGVAGRWVDFRSLPGGVVYYPVFRERLIARLIKMFGERPRELIAAAAPLGGKAIAMADWAIEIPAFARVPVVFALWEGSAEFGPEAAVMFDEALPSYLDTEDAIVVCEEILGEMRQHVQSV